MKWFKFKNEITPSNTEDVLLKAIMNGGTITREDAMSIPAISGASDLITKTFAMIPFKLYQEEMKGE